MDGGLTWQDAKVHAQQMEVEIAALIPPEVVVSIDQQPSGVLMSCSKTEYTWTGVTFVTVVDGTPVEATVREMEDAARTRFADRGLVVSDERLLKGTLLVTIEDPHTAEIYLFGEGEPGTISIDSSSPCFTLPEGVYPGGNF